LYSIDVNKFSHALHCH
jgi:hypothetical protein